MKVFGVLFLFCAILPETAVAVEDAQRSEAYYHFMLGALKERSRKYQEAIQEYRTALEHDPKAPEIFTRLADLYIQTNRVEEAIQEATKSIEQNPDNKEAHRMLGQIYMEKMYSSDVNPQDITSAIHSFQEVRRIDPSDPSVLLALGQLHLQNRQPQQASEYLVQYLKEDPDSQVALMSLASSYQQLNQYDQAIVYLLKYAELNPGNLFVIQQIADTYAKMGNAPQALDFQKRAYESDPDNPVVLRKYVELLGQNQRYPDAVQLLEKRVREEPGKIEWTSMLARVYQKMGNQERAEAFIKERLETDPRNLDLSLSLVQVYEEGDKFKESLAQLQTMLKEVEADKTMSEQEKKANLALIYSHMGYSAQQSKDFEGSLQYYRQAREVVEPQDTAKIDFYIALSYRGQKRYDEAITTLNGVVNENPGDTDAWELLSLLYEEKGEITKSDEITQRLIDAYPGSPQYYVVKAERLQRRENYEESVDYLKNLLPKFPENEQILFLLAAGLERMKRYDEAEEYFTQVLSLNPHHADSLNYLGYMLIDANLRVEEAIGYVKRALEIDQGNGAYLDSLGWGYFKLNQLQLAEDNLRQAVRKLPDNAVVNDHLGDLYFRLGKFQQAIEYWEIALRNKTNEIDTQWIQKKIDDAKKRSP